MKNSLPKKSASLFLTLLMIISLSFTAYAENINLKKNKSANRPFAVENMFPGDVETNDYTVNVKHKKPINLYFTVDVHPDGEKLAEVLMLKVYLPEKQEMLYEGPMGEFPRQKVSALAADETQVLYRITAYLDTSVGNEYMEQNLSADFRWWYEEEAEESTPGGGSGAHVPDTSDNSNIVLWAVIAAVSFAALIILLVKKKKEEEE